MQIEVRKETSDFLVRLACSYTINADSKMTLANIYKCEHSPMRTQMFTVEMIGIPTFVSVHFVRHKIGVEHFVKSNRDDRGADFVADRNTPVNHLMFCNAEALINMAKKRLCYKAHQETISVMQKIRDGVDAVDSDLAYRMVKMCVYRNGCNEIKSCGYFDRIHNDKDKW